MRLLLDTHAFLWFASGDRRLSRRARKTMEADDAELCVSAASVWEMAIKASLGRLTLPTAVGPYMSEKLAEGYRLIHISWIQAAAVQQLPMHHRDPFDRLLIAQAQSEGYPLVTRDPVFRKYEIDVVW